MNNVLVSLTKETIPNGVIVNGPVFVGNQISEEYLFEAQLEANNASYSINMCSMNSINQVSLTDYKHHCKEVTQFVNNTKFTIHH